MKTLAIKNTIPWHRKEETLVDTLFVFDEHEYRNLDEISPSIFCLNQEVHNDLSKLDRSGSIDDWASEMVGET